VPRSQIVALARNPGRATELIKRGVKIRHADYDDPDSVAQALLGTDTVMLISGSEVGRRVEQHRAVIQAAAVIGATRLVYTSMLHAEHSRLALAGEHAATEKIITYCGIGYTLLRNSWYAENYTAAIAGAAESGVLIGSAGKGRLSAAGRADYATAAVNVLTGGDHHRNKTYELGGEPGWTYPELAAEIARQTGRQIIYRDLQPDDHRRALISRGIPDATADTLVSFDAAIARGDLFTASGDLAYLMRRSAADLSDVVTAALSATGLSSTPRQPARPPNAMLSATRR
jgi:NAD(P)H dehydrogenase (quinone)